MDGAVDGVADGAALEEGDVLDGDVLDGDGTVGDDGVAVGEGEPGAALVAAGSTLAHPARRATPSTAIDAVRVVVRVAFRDADRKVRIRAR